MIRWNAAIRNWVGENDQDVLDAEHVAKLDKMIGVLQEEKSDLIAQLRRYEARQKDSEREIAALKQAVAAIPVKGKRRAAGKAAPVKPSVAPAPRTCGVPSIARSALH